MELGCPRRAKWPMSDHAKKHEILEGGFCRQTYATETQILENDDPGRSTRKFQTRT